MFKRALKRLAAGAFDHETAQRYELESAKQTIREAYPALLKKWHAVTARGERWHDGNDLWFQGDAALWSAFVDHVRDRRALEIGAGPFGFMAPATWIRERTVIDPLAEAYRRYELELCGESWFDSGVRLVSRPAEQIVPELVGQIDGCIVCQNALDHVEDPLAVLQAIGEYSAPGCWLLLWTDIWHLDDPDEGHHNITRRPEVLDRLLEGLGFEILKRARPIRQPNEYLEYGCIARR